MFDLTPLKEFRGFTDHLQCAESPYRLLRFTVSIFGVRLLDVVYVYFYDLESRSLLRRTVYPVTVEEAERLSVNGWSRRYKPVPDLRDSTRGL